MIAGQHYFFTVIAYNNIGLRTILSSDGFIVDLTGPVAGVVYNTDRNRNYAIQAATSTFNITWHGFMDLETGVKGYYVALFEDSEIETIVYNFTYVSIQTSVTLTNLSLIHGKRYYGAVKAINTGDILSDIVVSESKLIDTTPPEAHTCKMFSLVYEDPTQISKSSQLAFSADFEVDKFYIFSGNIDGSAENPQIQLHLGQSISTQLPIYESHDGRLSLNYRFLSNIEGVHNITLVTESLDPFNYTAQLQKCSVSDLTEEGLIVTQVSSDSFKASFSVMDKESGIRNVSTNYETIFDCIKEKKKNPSKNFQVIVFIMAWLLFFP